MNERKILIISHNPINKFDNMGKTIGNIFSQFNDQELCQLYFKNQSIEASNCNNFFCIDDVSMCKSIINRKYKTGKRKQNNTIIDTLGEFQDNVFEYGRKRTGLIYILRDILWKLGKWNTKELKEWLKEQKITSIFLVAGDYIFPFNIALKLSKKYKIPLYAYYVDEFYRKNIGKQTMLAKIHKLLYRQKFKKVTKYSKQYFCISEKMENFYSKQFNKDGIVLMNTTEIVREDNTNYMQKEKVVISYIGNLGYDRWKNIIDIANTIVQGNLTSKIEFNIYSGERNKKVIEKLNSTEGLFFKGKINGDEVKETIKCSDVLLHVEDFSKININKVLYSVSTKIPDSLASGKILMLYGPAEVESINYVDRNNAGIIINSKEDILKNLENLLKNNINRDKILNNASDLVEKNHRNIIIYSKLDNYLI